MSATLRGTFDTRREAEMTVERLVQEFGMDRAAITVMPVDEENSAGEEQAGSDNPADRPGEDGRADAALRGAITVAVEAGDEAAAAKVRAAFAEFGG